MTATPTAAAAAATVKPQATLGAPAKRAEAPASGAEKLWERTPFPINEQINKKVELFRGDIADLKADAYVNPTNEGFTELGYILQLAGPELRSCLKKRSYKSATGGIKITPGFKSNFTHILHVVPPKYQPKYKTAAETALFNTYFRLLETIISKKIKSVVMPVLSTPKCNLPFEDNFRMQLRVIRRLLEKNTSHIERIVIPLPDNEVSETTFFCYFPRTQADEENACYQLEPSVGGPNGEPIIPGREIRIKAKPASSSFQASDAGLDLSTVVGRNPFSKMNNDKQIVVKRPQKSCIIL